MTNIIKYLSLILVMLTMGCTQEVVMPGLGSTVEGSDDGSQLKIDHKSATWTISDQFTPTEIESILFAAEVWQEITKGRVQLALEVATVTERTPFTITREKLPNDCCAAVTANTMDQIIIDAEEYPDAPCVGRLWHIAAHEFGHTLGIKEHGGDGVMREHKPTCYASFTQSDLELFNQANPE